VPARSLPVHATQIYSSINAALLCLLLWAYYPMRRRDGEVFAALLLLYPITRILLEVVRVDEGGKFGTGLTISQLVSLVLIAASIVLWIYVLRQPPGSALPCQGEFGLIRPAGLVEVECSRIPENSGVLLSVDPGGDHPNSATAMARIRLRREFNDDPNFGKFGYCDWPNSGKFGYGYFPNSGEFGYWGGLSFRELYATPSTVQAVFLPFFHAAVPRQKTLAAKRDEKFGVVADQGPRDPHAARSRLAGRSSPGDPDRHVHQAALADGVQHFRHRSPILIRRKKLVQRTFVNRDLTGTRPNPNSSHRRFPSPGTERIPSNLVLFHSYHKSDFKLK
jgi:hypothetical protein